MPSARSRWSRSRESCQRVAVIRHDVALREVGHELVERLVHDLARRQGGGHEPGRIQLVGEVGVVGDDGDGLVLEGGLGAAGDRGRGAQTGLSRGPLMGVRPVSAPAWITDQPIAHRGLHGDGVPENSERAIEAAIRAGYAVEIDVRLSGDGVPIVFHDETVDRLTEEAGPVDERRWAELADLQLAGTAQRVPRLETVLDEVAGRAPLLLELKNWEAPGRLEQTVHEAVRGYEGPVAVQSFNPRSMAWFHRHASSIPRGQVSGPMDDIPVEWYNALVLERLLVNAISRPDFVAYRHDRLPYWPVAVARRLGLPVLGWTIRSSAEHETAKPHIDNLVFEGFRP
jgi:glycerophosphoryl diester phosphodiesterase